jgi:glycosyltransferase involved in cell wall biosynthesis
MSLSLTTINIRASANGVSGYGRLIQDILRELPKQGVEASFIPLENIPVHLRKEYFQYFDCRRYNLRDPELLICPPCSETEATNPIFRLNPHKARSILTMWEASHVSFSFIEEMNKVGKILVPNAYNKFHFERQGVYVPIVILPLYVNSDVFRPIPANQGKPFVFGTGNHDPRKRLERTVMNFRRAFPREQDVCLRIKLSPHEPGLNLLDDRIQVYQGTLSEQDLAQWYNGIDVFVSSVSAEGWGFMQLEAMACGKPVIATCYAGLAEFLTQTNGFPIPHFEEYANGYWEIPGAKWSTFNDLDMITTMQSCYRNREMVREKGRLAVETAKKFTLNRFVGSLLGELRWCFPQ